MAGVVLPPHLLFGDGRMRPPSSSPLPAAAVMVIILLLHCFFFSYKYLFRVCFCSLLFCKLFARVPQPQGVKSLHLAGRWLLLLCCFVRKTLGQSCIHFYFVETRLLPLWGLAANAGPGSPLATAIVVVIIVTDSFVVCLSL